MIHKAREVLNPLVSDIHIAAQYDPAPLVPDMSAPGKGKKKLGIGFGLSLVAESSVPGVLYSADVVAPPEGGITPEDLGMRCAYQLAEIIQQGGCVTWTASKTVLTLMAMGSEDVGRLRVSKDTMGSEDVLQLARDLRQFGAASWGLRPVESDDSGDIIVSVKGSGVGNVGRKMA